MMKSHKNYVKALFFIAGFAVSSCISKDRGTNYLQFSGTLEVDVPTYVYSNTDYTIKVGGLSHASGDLATGYGISYTLSTTIETDTIRGESDLMPDTFVIHTPSCDTSTFTLTVNAFATYYASQSTSSECNVIDTVWNTGTVRGIEIPDGSVPMDCGGKLYYVTTVGSNTWIRQNLSNSSKGISYLEEDAIAPITGRFFTWEEAQSVCPAGWHLPSDAEWLALCKDYSTNSPSVLDDFYGAAGSIMANATYNGEKMWEYWPQVPITDASKFSALSYGYAVYSNSTWSFKDVRTIAAFWTSDSDSKDSTKGVYRYIHVEYNNVYRGIASKSNFAASVRCVKDK